ncbi:MAG: endonuclease/exonuclease/phosphatase family protein [Candidatus Margulisbacteria bacterium]|nr:endonuclease/exonuclease/phosphatase family protein [Candidatus Margulisiibacteriota bacterium]
MITISSLTFLSIIFMGIALVYWAVQPQYPKHIKFTGIRQDYAQSVPPPPEALKVMTYNIAYGAGMDNLKGHVTSKETLLQNLDEIAHTVKDNGIDILCLQEVDIKSRRSHGIDEVSYIANLCGFSYMAFALNWDHHWVPYPMNFDFKHHFGRMVSGSAILSKYPIQTHQVLLFEKPASNPFWYNWFYLDRSAQIVDVQLGERQVIRLVNVHLEAYDTNTRETQINTLMTHLNGLKKRPTLLVGDFNTVPSWAPQKNQFEDEPETDFTRDSTYSQVSQVFEPAIGEKIPNLFTFPSNTPNRKLDHVFYDPSAFTVGKAEVISGGLASDHLPVVVEVESLTFVKN